MHVCVLKVYIGFDMALNMGPVWTFSVNQVFGFRVLPFEFVVHEAVTFFQSKLSVETWWIKLVQCSRIVNT